MTGLDAFGVVAKAGCFHPIYEGLLELIVSRAAFWSRRSGPLFVSHICSPQPFIGAKGISERQPTCLALLSSTYLPRLSGPIRSPKLPLKNLTNWAPW